MRRAEERPSARRARFEKSVSEERWLVSYADFITLLFAFFVVMYSVSQVNESKYRSLSETLNSAFTSQPAGIEEQNDTANLADLTEIQQALTEQLAGFPIEGQVRMSANESWVEVSLSSEFLFSSGSSEPSANANTLFSELAGVLEDIENEVQIVGHTDDVPISNAEFANNWALSSARAVAVVNALAFQGVKPERLSATGFGEHRPIASNETADGRRQNRRVVIRVGSRAAPDETASGASDLIGSPAVETSFDSPILNEAEPENLGDEDSAPQALPNGIQPLRLKGGDLLFTSDPGLPRTRELEE